MQFYGLDFGGGGLSAVAGLPHVGGVASRLDPEKVRRTAAEVYGVMTRREEYFRTAGISSIAEFRARRARGDVSVTDQPWGDVFLVIDGWGNFRTDYDALEPVVLDIATRGPRLRHPPDPHRFPLHGGPRQPQGPVDEPPGTAAR
ncbi:hypothetical protein GCM10023238_12960 [Streptomyces heliomycini]